MRYGVVVFLWWILLALPAHGQDVAVPAPLTTSEAVPVYPEPQPLHVTDYLSERPEARASLLEFHTRREDAQLPRAVAPATTYRTGDTRSFRVFNFVEGEREPIEFTLMVVDGDLRLWVETEELDTVTSEELDRLRQTFLESTPGRSVDPDQGIIALSTSIFGERPDVRGDGSLDVLLLDIRDRYHPEHRPQFVAGFVDPADLSDRGNERDVLYLDLRPGLVRADGSRRSIHNLESTAAHEYQHLVHLNYDRSEVTFVNEGLSEWSEVLHGYQRRDMGYLGFQDTYNVDLLRWRPRGTPEVIQDYERAGLLTTYLAERLGIETTGSITRDPAVGSRGYKNAADDANEQLRDLLLDFHLANYLNDAQVHPRLGYSTDTFEELRAEPAPRTDGRTAAAYSGHLPLRPGAVQYLKWTHVEEFSVHLEGAAPLRARAILERDGVVTIEHVPVGTEHPFFGTYDRIVLALVHVDPDADPLTAHFNATWTAEQFYRPETLAYDEGAAQHYVRARDQEVLSRFTNPFPEEGFLASVEVPIYFFSQFSNPDAPPRTAPRFFTLVIRDVTDDGTPGSVLFALSMQDPRPFWRVSGPRLRFLYVDLTEHAEELASLPESVFIGFRDVGTPLNENVFPVAPYTSENVSYVGSPGEWTRLWDYVVERVDQEDLSLAQTAIPLRATYFTPTDDPPSLEDDPLPALITLSPNAPNPFPTTSRMSYTLPRDMHVRLEVHDTLGRRVALLRDGGQVAGRHEVTLDGRTWGSGVYFVTLTAEGERMTRSVVVIR